MNKKMDCCCIPCCEFSDTPNEPLLIACNNLKLHKGCLIKLIQSEDSPKCPVCRDDYLGIVKSAVRESSPQYEDPIEVFLGTNVFLDVFALSALLTEQHRPNELSYSL
jgi:hypothetical protein